MPPFLNLPTTSSVSFVNVIDVPSHPSLPFAASSRRSQVRAALKAYKRATEAARPSHLPQVLNSLQEYLPYIVSIDAGLSDRTVTGEELHVILRQELDSEWRPIIATSILPSRGTARLKLKGFDAEVGFALLTYAAVRVLQAREELRWLVSANHELPTDESRKECVARASAALLDANCVYSYVSSRGHEDGSSSSKRIADLSPEATQAMAKITLAEATLAIVSKDDVYFVAMVRAQNKQDTEWMFKAPTIAKSRLKLLARFCMAAAEHAQIAVGLLGSVSNRAENVKEYAELLKRVARARACRLLGQDADEAGRTAEGIGWLQAARNELQHGDSSTASAEADKKNRGFSKLKDGWKTRREEKKVEKGGDWGMDAGKSEETRVVSALLEQWEKQNNTVIASVWLTYTIN